MADEPQRVPVVFYQTPAGAGVVLEWLRSLSEEDQRVIGRDLMRSSIAGRSGCRFVGRWAAGSGKCAAVSRAIASRG